MASAAPRRSEVADFIDDEARTRRSSEAARPPGQEERRTMLYGGYGCA